MRLGLFVVSMIDLFIQSRSVCRTMIFLRQALVTVVSIIYGDKQAQSAASTQRFLFHRQAYCIIAAAQMLPLASGLQFALQQCTSVAVCRRFRSQHPVIELLLTVQTGGRSRQGMIGP